MNNLNRLYKNKRRGKLFGVCAGVAEYFGINPFSVRVATAIGCFVFPFMVPFAYIVSALLLDDKPQDLYQDKTQEKFYSSMRYSPKDTLSSINHRYADIENRIQTIEKKVTSKSYQFDQELR